MTIFISYLFNFFSALFKYSPKAKVLVLCQNRYSKICVVKASKEFTRLAFTCELALIAEVWDSMRTRR